MKNEYLEFANTFAEFAPRAKLTIDESSSIFEERGWTMVEENSFYPYYTMALQSPDSEVLVFLCVYNDVIVHVAVEQ